MNLNKKENIKQIENFINNNENAKEEEYAYIIDSKSILKKDGLFIGSVNGIQGLEFIKETAKELDYHYYYNKDKYIRLFDVEDLKKYLNIFDIIKIDERVTIRFEHKKNYIV